MLDAIALAQQCAPSVHPNTIEHVMRAESAFNPYAIGVVGAHLERQPKNISEALATAKWLAANDYNFSVGLMQVNRKNFSRNNLTIETAFEPCANVSAGAKILQDCYERASLQPARIGQPQAALRDAYSCYYSGNFKTGYSTGYVLRVVTGRGKISISKNRNRNKASEKIYSSSEKIEIDTASAVLF